MSVLRSALRGSSLLAALVVPSASSVAYAQTPFAGTDTAIDAQNFWPMAGPAESLVLRSSMVQPSGAVGFGLVANFMRLPLVTTDPASGVQSPSIDYVATTDFVWSLGLFKRFQVSVAVPVVVAQSGDGATPVLGGDHRLGETALRDLRAEISWAIVQRERRPTATGFGLRLDVGAGFPFGDDQGFQSSGGFTFAPMLAADVRTSLVTITANVGARVRDKVATFANLTWGSQLVGGLGLAVRPGASSRLNLTADAFATVPLVTRVPTDSLTTLEGFVGARYATDQARDVEVFAGVGLPLTNTALTPAWRGLVGLSYAPRGNDTDGDRIIDADDRCVTEVEDRDQFEDDDGCPDLDNDSDTVPDTSDRCPNEPEDADNFEDADGCPDADNDSDGVTDTDDQCPNDAAGEHPDPERAGCAIPDTDGDGVLDPDDRCTSTPAGARPDPARAGCPIPDNDHDGIADADDRCPADAAGDHPDQFRSGCPDLDVDRDGVQGADDRCPAEPETINGLTDDDGCPDTGAEIVTWEEGGEALRFARPLAVVARATVLPPATLAVLAQAAQRIRGRGAEVTRVIVEVDPGVGAPAVTEAARLAGVVGDALIARRISQRLIETRATPAPAPLPAGTRAPVGVRVPGRVHIRIETPTTVHAPAAPPAAAPTIPARPVATAAPARPAAPAIARPAAAIPRPAPAAR